MAAGFQADAEAATAAAAAAALGLDLSPTLLQPSGLGRADSLPSHLAGTLMSFESQPQQEAYGSAQPALLLADARADGHWAAALAVPGSGGLQSWGHCCALMCPAVPC
jgi:hypothetical protein